MCTLWFGVPVRYDTVQLQRVTIHEAVSQFGVFVVNLLVFLHRPSSAPRHFEWLGLGARSRKEKKGTEQMENRTKLNENENGSASLLSVSVDSFNVWMSPRRFGSCTKLS